MSILIKGLFGKDMPMPQEGYVDIRIHFKSGKLKCVTMPTGEDPFYATFDVEKLPPHGRLGDLDALVKDLAVYRGGHNEGYGFDGGMYEAYNNSIELVEEAPTVIEAEGETDA